MAFKVEACGPPDLENRTLCLHYLLILENWNNFLQYLYFIFPLSSFFQPFVREPRNTLRLPWKNKWNLWVHT